MTGGNRGIGLEVCRQLSRRKLRVILTARDEAHGREAQAKLKSEQLEVRFELLDVSSRESIARCAQRLTADRIEVDILINNAGIYGTTTLLDTSPKDTDAMLTTNLLGALWCCQTFMPGMNQRGYGRIVNVSSGLGSITPSPRGSGPYALSKAALNLMTQLLAKEARTDIKINSVNPGWVKTRMGGTGAPRSVEEGADTIVWAATLPADGPHGQFLEDRKIRSW